MKGLEDNELEQFVREALVSAGRDPREVYARVHVAGETYQLWCSDGGSLRQLLPKLQERVGRTAVRGIELPLPEWRGRTAWITASVADVRAHPQHSAEQVTQALQGEELTPLATQDGWLLARQADGYVGWIREWHLRVVDEGVARGFRERCDGRIQASSTVLLEQPREDAPVCGESLLGTAIVIRRRHQGWAEIELPGGREGWVPGSHIREGTVPWPCDPPAILESLQRFIGVPYVWGGRSPKGFDCSGLVQFVFGLHGIALPRDSDQQYTCGTAASQLEPADLLFFGRDTIGHVAVVMSNGTFIHARGEVRFNALEPESALYDAELARIYRGARRVLTQNV